MEKHWSVSVNIGANNIINIGDNYLSGWDNALDYADTIKGCADHLLSFIGEETDTTIELRADNAALTAENTRIFAMVDAREQTIAELTALCDGYRGEGDALRVENGRLREELGEEEHDISLTDKLAMSESVAEQWTRRAEIAESALTRARAEGMEEERGRCCRIVDEVASTYCGTIAGNQAAETIAAIMSAAKGEQ